MYHYYVKTTRLYCKGSVYVPEVVYTLLPIDYVRDSQSASDSRLYTYSIASFFSAMPPKDLAPFSYTYPQKPLF